MNGRVHGYDIDLYNRNFLNCAQRHSIVMLKERGMPVDLLFYNTLVPTDVILDQAIRRQVPKYDFECESLSAEDFARIGVRRQEHFVQRFADAKPALLEAVARDGFVLLAGDVYYFPHCPEFRNKHLFHLVILRGYDALRDEWDIVDDNPASVLAQYRYGSDLVAAFYENSTVCEFRTYEQVPRPPALVREEIRAAAAAYMAGYRDDRRLLTGIEALLACPWFEAARLHALLSAAFSLLSGSRLCFARHLREVGAPETLAAAADAVAADAAKLRNAAVRAQATGSLAVPQAVRRAADIAVREASLADGYAGFLSGVPSGGDGARAFAPS